MIKRMRVQSVKIKSFNKKDVITRLARVNDIPELLRIENLSFSYDQLGRRNFHWMIKHAHSILLVMEYKSSLIGYGLVLMNSGTGLARLYSICTLKEFQGHGLAGELITQLEEKAADKNCGYLRLEVKADNKGAIALYEKLGYRRFTVKEHYYDDGRDAFCYEKQIKSFKQRPRLDVPYYQQQTDFTCGPSCLMMAMKTFNKKMEMSLSEELQIWREATTIFMTSGHGGCGPQGLAVAAKRRGYSTELFISHEEAMFLDTVRSPQKKEIIALVQTDFEKKLHKQKVKIHRKKISLGLVKEILKKGGIPIVLISTYHFDNNRIPHWVVVTAYDDHFIYIHDPDQDDPGADKIVVEKAHIPIPEDQFIKATRWGKDRMCATVVIYKNKKKKKSF